MFQRQKIKYIRHAFLLGFLIICSALNTNISTIHAENEKTEILVFSKNSESQLLTALQIDKKSMNIHAIINETTINDYSLNDFEKDLQSIDVIFSDRLLPSDNEALHLLKSYINGSNGNKGLIFYGILNGTGPSAIYTEADFNEQQVRIISELLPVIIEENYSSSTNDSTQSDYKIQTRINPQINQDEHILTKNIPWESAPAIGYRTLVRAKPAATTIMESIDGEFSIVSRWKLISGATVVFLSMEILQENLPFKLWPYFNYLNYVLALHTNPNILDSEILNLVDWGYGPVPKKNEIFYWFILVGFLWVATYLIYAKFKSLTKNDERYKILLPKYAEESKKKKEERKRKREEEKQTKENDQYNQNNQNQKKQEKILEDI